MNSPSMSSPAIPGSAQQPAALASPVSQPQPAPRPTVAELFIAFAAISLSGFGGVLAWARRKMVEERRWLTAEQFNEVYALCAFYPEATSSISRSFSVRACAARPAHWLAACSGRPWF
jgi:Chromate transporter